ncbi:MAG TPA: serine acetyltransferase [Candidatus Krumholzibacteria bacterium]|nr:serine acetyltransferase [Candidatus Krumholzibacteria bacterium]HPD72441.1 serine acetyltransferase [Candidatus Krumholzibacteria bacterium]HRY40627.1 serine acetyltransferase [Candidatus Krumholzibacteria bacterium]
MTDNERNERLWNLAERLAATYRHDGVINRIGEKDLPSQATIVRILDRLLSVVFPGYFGDPVPRDTDLCLFAATNLDRLQGDLTAVLDQTLRFSRRHGCTCASLWTEPAGGQPESDLARVAHRLAFEYLENLPAIRTTLRADAQAAYEGDPAAASTDEVVLCYPGLLAIAVHRLAHPLHRLGVPLVPRIMSEWAHHRSGVDIHPGAEIGGSFFIDHGTGTVIGETTVIGDRVKLYQGVTLGALSFPRNPDGSLVKGGRRHPTVEDDATIYAGATILGGATVIGRGAVIGGGAWITESVPAGARIQGGRPGVSVAR